MTDKDKLLSLLQDFGIAPIGKGHINERIGWDNNAVVIHENDEGIEGYVGFYCKFDFDEQGKFISVGVWE